MILTSTLGAWEIGSVDNWSEHPPRLVNWRLIDFWGPGREVSVTLFSDYLLAYSMGFAGLPKGAFKFIEELL